MAPNYPAPLRSYLDYPYCEYELQSESLLRKYSANSTNKSDALNRPIYASPVPSPIVSYVPANIRSYAPNIPLSSPYNALSPMGYNYSGQQYLPFQINPEYSFYQLRNDNNRPTNYTQERSNCPRKYSNSVYGDTNDISSESANGSPKANTPSPKPARYRGKPNKCIIYEMTSTGDNSTQHKLLRHNYTPSTTSNRYSIADTDSLQCSEVSLYTNNTSILDYGDETGGKDAENLNDVSISSSVASNNKEEYSSSSLEETVKKQVSKAPSHSMLIGPGGQLLTPEKYAKRFQRAKSTTPEKELENDHNFCEKHEGQLNYPACEVEPTCSNENEADPSTLALPSDVIMIPKNRKLTASSADSVRLVKDECVKKCQSEHNINHGKTPETCETTQFDEVEPIPKTDSSVTSPRICSASNIEPNSIVAKSNEKYSLSHGNKSEIQCNITDSRSHLEQSGRSIPSLSKETLLKRSSSTNSVTTKFGGMFIKEKRVSSDSASVKSNSPTPSSTNVLSRIRGMTQKYQGHSTNLDTQLPSPYQDSLNKSRIKRWIPGGQKKSFVVANSIRVSDGKSMGTGSNSTEIISDPPATGMVDGGVKEKIHESKERDIKEQHDISPENGLKQDNSNCASNEKLHSPMKSNSPVVLRSAMKKVSVKPRIQRSGALSKPSVSFSENVKEHPVYSFEEYDRNESDESADKITTLQALINSHPRVEYEICQEINAFKRTMVVHPLSRQNTQFMKVSLRNIDQ